MKSSTIITLLFCLSQISIAQVNITFEVKALTLDSTNKLGIRGDQPPLSWEKTIYLEPHEVVNTFITSIDFDSERPFFEYKYVIEDLKGEVIYELDGQENRLAFLSDNKTMVIEDQWDVQPVYYISDLPSLPAEYLQEDADILGQALWQLHPGVERYLDSAAFFVNLEDLKQTFNQPMSYTETFRHLSTFVATLRCGHTYANPYNQSGFIKKILLSQPDKLPFGLVWIDKRLFITKNATGDPAFNRGAEILSINGVPIKEFADQLLPMVKGDGSNEAVRYEQLNVVGYDAYELFDIYFPLVVRPKEGSFDLKLRTVSGEIVMTKVKPITRKERIDVFQNKYDDLPKTIDETWSCRIINNRIAYLKLGTFTVWNFEMDWKKYLKEAFKKFEKENTTDLIIDIRGNEGGLDAVIEELQQYMLKKDCDYGAFEERIRYTYVDEELRPYLKTWDNGIYDFRGKVSQNSNGSYSFTSKKDQIMRFKRSNKAFEGNIYLFVNAANSSSTFYLTSITKTCGSAEIVGETTGGNQKGLNGGNIFFLRLPNSGIEIDIPVYGQFNDAAADGGIEPDVFIKRRPEDLKNSTDGQLDRLVELIENE